MKFLITLAFLSLAHLVTANDQMRAWTFASGLQTQAEITGFDEATREVTLRTPEGKTITLDESEFAAIDKAWILQWIEQDEEARAQLARIGGTVTRYTTTGEFATTYTLYQPPVQETADNAKPPLLFLFHPGGNGGRMIYRYTEAAAANGVTLVSFDHFRNTKNPEEVAEMEQRFKAILPQIEAAVPHDEKKMFMGGTSGGAWRSYHYSAQVPRPWAGILAAGGWLGGEEWYELPYPKIRVAMVNGDKDHAANQFIDPDTEILQRAGSTVSVHAFEGGHQMPPSSVLTKALHWLLESDAPAEAAP